MSNIKEMKQSVCTTNGAIVIKSCIYKKKKKENENALFEAGLCDGCST